MMDKWCNNPGVVLARQLAGALQSDLDIALRKDQARRQAESSPTPRLDRIRPRVLRALHVYGWTSPEISQIDRTFTVHARLAVEGQAQLRGTLRFTEDGVLTMEGSGGPVMVDDLRAEKLRNPALAAVLEGVL